MEPQRRDDQAIEDAASALLSARHAPSLAQHANGGALAAAQHANGGGFRYADALAALQATEPLQHEALRRHAPPQPFGQSQPQQHAVQDLHQYHYQHQQPQVHPPYPFQQQQAQPLQQLQQTQRAQQTQQPRPVQQGWEAQPGQQARHQRRLSNQEQQQQIGRHVVGPSTRSERPGQEHGQGVFHGQLGNEAQAGLQPEHKRGKPAQPRQRHQQNEKEQRPKQPKAPKKRKTKNKQRQEIDEILAQAETQPEFAREYEPSFRNGVPMSHGEVLPRPNTTAVIRPGQSIVPRPYQRRPIDIDPRLRAIPGIHGLYVGDVKQNSMPLPTLRTISGVHTASKAASKVFPGPSFPSGNEQSLVNHAVWSHRNQGPAQHRQQAQQLPRATDPQMRYRALFNSLQQPPTQAQPRAETQLGRLFAPPGPDQLAFAEQQTRRQLEVSRLKPTRHEAPASNAYLLQQQQQVLHPHLGQVGIPLVSQMPSSDSTMQRTPAHQSEQILQFNRPSEHHYYMAPSSGQQQQKGNPLGKFEDSLWDDQDQRSVAANSVSSTFQGTVRLEGVLFDASSALKPTSALLPSLDFRTKKSSDWFYPTVTGNKNAPHNTGESRGMEDSRSSASSLLESHVLVQSARRADESVVSEQHLLNSRVASSHGFTGSGGSIPGVHIHREQAIATGDGVSNAAAKVNVMHNIAQLSNKPLSNNRLRKMQKQTRRQERKETAKAGRGKQLSSSVEAHRQQPQKHSHPDEVVQEGEGLGLERSPPHHLPLSQASGAQPMQHTGSQQQTHERAEHASQMPQLKHRIAVPSQPATKTSNRTGSGGRELAHKCAVQREQEVLLRRAHLTMVAQQQLQKRKVEDSLSSSRPVPTIVAKRSAGLNRVPPGRPDEQRDVRHTPAPTSRAEGGDVPLLSVASASPTGGVAGPLQTAGKEVGRKPRKRKAVLPVSALPGDNTQQPDALVDSRPAQRPRTERCNVIDLTSIDIVAPAADTIAPKDVVATPEQDDPPVVPVPDASRSETETVLIFCKRDFFRYQAGLLWKKYQEVKRKRDQTLATVTGRRARYLNARYTSAKAGNADAMKQVKVLSSRGNKQPGSSVTSTTEARAVIEIIDDDDCGTDGDDSTHTSVQSDNVEEVCPQQDASLNVSPADPSDTPSTTPHTDVKPSHEHDDAAPPSEASVTTSAVLIDAGADTSAESSTVTSPELNTSPVSGGDGASDGSIDSSGATSDASATQDTEAVFREECVV